MIKKTFAIAILVIFVVSMVTGVSASGLEIQDASTAPTIDGVKSSGEWGEVLFRIENGLDNVTAFGEDPRMDDFSADIYAQWDDENLYVLVVADYEQHENDYPANEMYMEDCLQLAIGPNTSKITARNEFGFALGTDLSTQMSHAWFEVVGGGINDVDFKIARSGTKTTYEMAIPWTAIAEQSDVDLIGDGHKIYFSAAFTLGRDGGWLAIEYMSSVVGSKEIAQAAELTLKQAESSVGDETQQPGDGNSVLYATILMLAFSIITILLYKKRVKA